MKFEIKNSMKEDFFLKEIALKHKQSLKILFPYKSTEIESQKKVKTEMKTLFITKL